MSYDPNGPLAVRPIEEWFVEQRRGFVICDPFVQAGVESAPKAPLEPGQFPAALEESEFLRGGFRFWKRATETFPDLEIGVLVTLGNHSDDLDGEYVDEFEDALVARAGFVAYGLGTRLETNEEAETVGRWRHEYGRRIEDAGTEFGVPVLNVDPVVIPGLSLGGTEDLLTGMDDAVRALAFELGPDHGLVKAAYLHARHIWQIHAVGRVGVYLDGLQLPPEGPGLLIVPGLHLGTYTKICVAMGDAAAPSLAVVKERLYGPDAARSPDIRDQGAPRVGVSPMNVHALPPNSTEWDDALVMERGHITRRETQG